MWIKKIVPGQGIQIVEDIHSTISFLHCAKRRERVMAGLKTYRAVCDQNNRTEEVLGHGYSLDEVKRCTAIVKSLRKGEVVNLPSEDLWLADLIIAADKSPAARVVRLLDIANAPWDMYPNTTTPQVGEYVYW